MNSKTHAALKMGTLSPDGKVTTGKNIINSIAAAPSVFPTSSLPLPLASATNALDDLHNAILATATGSAGSVSNMHEKERIVMFTFNILKAYVEMVANNTTDPQTVIEAAGMSVAKQGGNTSVTELTITALGNGSMEISVPRNTGEKAFVYFYSADNGNTWIEFECSTLATVTLKNQIPASSLQFKYAPIAKTKGAFSQIKTAIVL